MNESPSGSPSAPRPRAPGGRRWTLRRHVLTWLGVLCLIGALGIGALSLVFEWAGSEIDAQEKNCCWEEGATPAWVGEELGVRPPEAATDRRAGYKAGQRLDTGLLVFTLPTRDATGYVDRLVEGSPKTFPNDRPQKKDYSPADGFAHLGLPEPETLTEGMRTARACPDGLRTPEGKYLQRCVTLFLHEFAPGSTRLYFRATMEPAATPPPATGEK
ncbi:hypothetical protein ACFYVL_27010 [Streptomyces sp. NPDC004111]|uniref:hypothetical protein n=1 Tax=Streptomyces sp. NPDC004111 TaxID=3364690 RepID=UPI0036809557